MASNQELENERSGRSWQAVRELVTDAVDADMSKLAVMALASGLAEIMVRYRSPTAYAEVLGALSTQLELLEMRYQRALGGKKLDPTNKGGLHG